MPAFPRSRAWHTFTSADRSISVGGGKSQQHGKTVRGITDLIGYRVVARPSLLHDYQLSIVTSRGPVSFTPCTAGDYPKKPLTLAL